MGNQYSRTSGNSRLCKAGDEKFVPGSLVKLLGCTYQEEMGRQTGTATVGLIFSLKTREIKSRSPEICVRGYPLDGI